MFGLEIAFFALGFLTCLILIAIITEVNDKDKKNKREVKQRKYELEKEQEKEISSLREDVNIDIKVY